MHHDLNSVQGRRSAVLTAVSREPMSLMDICRALDVSDASDRARIRSALSFLERRNTVEIAVDENMVPIKSNGNILFQLRNTKRSRIPPRIVSKARANGKPIVAPAKAKPRPARDRTPIFDPSTLTTASIRSARAGTLLVTRVLPTMDRWLTIQQIADRADVGVKEARDCVHAGLHSQPPSVAGWAAVGRHPTFRIGDHCFYIAASLSSETPPAKPEPAAAEKKALGPAYEAVLEAIAAPATRPAVAERTGAGPVRTANLLKTACKRGDAVLVPSIDGDKSTLFVEADRAAALGLDDAGLRKARPAVLDLLKSLDPGETLCVDAIAERTGLSRPAADAALVGLHHSRLVALSGAHPDRVASARRTRRPVAAKSASTTKETESTEATSPADARDELKRNAAAAVEAVLTRRAAKQSRGERP